MLVGQKLDEVVAVENVQHLSIKWHPVREILGVSSHIPSTGGFVSFYTKKGGKPFYSSTVRPNQLPTFLDWHPFDSLLAVGWDSGRIELVHPTNRTESEIRGVDLGHICRLIWADNGSLMLAADEAGEIRSFQFDKRHASDQDQQPQRLTSGTIVDETPTDICSKLLDRKVLELPNASEKMTLQKSSSFGLNRRKSEGGNDGLSQLLSKHKKFMEFEEEKQLLSSKQKLHDNLAVFFLISTNKGGVYVFDPINGQLQRVFQADSSIRQLLNVPEKSSYILAISDGMMFYELAVEGRLANDKVKVKLSGKHEHFSMIGIDYEIIAICYGEREIRVWDLENEDNAAFGLSTDKGYDTNEQIICLSYSSKKDTISGATSTGKVASWRRQRRGINDETLPIDQQFRLQNALTLNTQINEMAWSPSSTALAINSTHSVEIFLSQGIDFFVDTEYAVIQVSAQVLTLIKITDPVETQELQLHTNIKGFFISGSHLLLWDENKIQLDQIIYTNDSPLRIQTLSSFDSPLISKALYYNQQIYTVEKDRLLINTIQGTLKKSVTFREIEGNPSLLDVNGKWLCVATSNGYFRIYDLSDENLKLAFHSSHVVKSVPNFAQFTSVKVNSAGNRISFTILQPNDEVFEKLLIWDAESDSVGYFSFASGVTDQQEYDTAASRAAGGENRPKTAAESKE
ncbi:intraflagellar transport protein [Ditylenchus destructor]|uniref:Intraflagellar transport protein n=1 Tax=Ditylenchus destructor TaxID=166010 RepID=A0AAD4NAK6_9BILA|nr:intraflagellar transport protein [Ditylenchus destructor]